jgi:predicted house-cleaning noncanonical NTP pyrophosphatase (MazG superfamily)
MRKFKQYSLSRDKMPAILEDKGSLIHVQKLSDAEYDQALRAKLQEEVLEVLAAKNENELLAELADIQEVIDALLALHVPTQGRSAIEALQTKKCNDRGGYFARQFVTFVEHPEGSPAADYYAAQPEKYPEIVDQA